ncbi:MAG: DUF998 domain-containing protein [Candidatus Bathyarchaeia archaeon]|jgi:hypothetical membrane protein
MIDRKRVGAAAGIAAPIVAFTCILSAIASYPLFSWTNNALSDLGVVEGVTSVLFTSGLVTAGVLAVIFAALGLFNYADSRLGKAGSIVFAAACMALVLIGIFNENYRPTHYLVSVAFFALAPIGLFILTSWLYRSRQRGTAALTVAIGFIAAIPWILQFTINYVPNVAIPETISALAVGAWAIIMSTKILKKR